MSTLRAGVGCAVAAAVLVPSLVFGQARSEYRWRTPGLQGLTKIGGDFTNYSRGLGSLESASPYGGSGLLRSSIGSPLIFGLSRTRTTGGVNAMVGTGAQGLTGAVSPAAGGTQFTKIGVGAGIAQGGWVSSLDGVDPDKLQANAYYLQAMGLTSRLAGNLDTSITSFVPVEPGKFREKMQEGDKFFRAGRYDRAQAAFNVALIVARRVPESHLSLVHANFAIGNYHMAANHLRQALKLLPELPLVRLSIRNFYGKQEDYEKHVLKLKETIEKNGYDPAARLVLAYVRYFAGVDAEAVKALREVHGQSSQNKRIQRMNLKAAESFSRGMVAAERAVGSLGPESRPAQPGKTPAKGQEESPSGSREPGPSEGVQPGAEAVDKERRAGSST